MAADLLHRCVSPIHAAPGAAVVLFLDPLQYFSWWVYGGVAVVYTALVFHGELSKKDGPYIFSERNARPLSEIISIHLVFLAIFWGLMQIGASTYRFLPNWITTMFDSRGSAYSVLDILYILAMIALHYVERRWLYVEPAT
jgi:hypothetical protein